MLTLLFYYGAASAVVAEEVAAPVGHPIYVKKQKKTSIEELRELVSAIGNPVPVTAKAPAVPPAEPRAVAIIATPPVVQRVRPIDQLALKRLQKAQAELIALQNDLNDEEELLALLAA